MPRGVRKFPLSELEQKIVKRVKLNSELRVSPLTLTDFPTYMFQGDITVVMVPTKQGILMGAAKKCLKDPYNAEIGQAVAFRRAIDAGVPQEYSG